MPRESSPVVPKGRRMCKAHPDKELELYCEKCETLMCLDGMVKDHWNHNYVLATKANESHIPNVKELAEKVKGKQLTIEQALEKIDKIRSQLGKQRAAEEDKVRTEFSILANMLHQRESELLDAIKQEENEKQGILQYQRKKLEAALLRIRKECEKANTTIADKSSPYNFIENKSKIVHSLKQLRDEKFPLDPEEDDFLFFVNSDPSLRVKIQSFGTIVGTINGKAGGDSVIEAMKKNKESIGVQERGCEALISISQNYEGRIAILEASGIATVLRGMKNHRQEATVQEKASIVLRNLCGKSDEVREVVGASGGVPIIVDALVKHASNPD
eukprot:143148-Rhodomonas_salina.1